MRRRGLRFALVGPALVGLAAVLAAGCAMQVGDEQTGTTEQASTCAAGSVVQGVDVSVYQGSITWPTVKAAGIDFAIARISDGSALDTTFATNWAGMQSAGIVRGAYQYFEPGQDPTTQAGIVVSAVGMLASGDLPVTADMETAGGQSPATVAANLQTWVNAVKSGTGKTPMIYTAPGFWNSSVASTAFGTLPLWAANWGVTCPTLATGWNNWEVWQYSDMGTVNGIPAMVDLDEFNGTLAQLQAFAGGASTAPDWAAQYVSQTWPLASTTIMMTACEAMHAEIVFKNIGAKAWDSNTRLATTQPRDRTSVFADATWLSLNRAAGVTGTVAPGSTFTFSFDFRAPDTAGTYDEFFGLVEDGTAWFSDPGQGGPPDNDIEAKIQVTPGDGGPCPVSLPDGGLGGDAGTPGDSGVKAGPDAGAGTDSGVGVSLDSGGGGSDAAGWNSDSGGNHGGCGCRVVSGDDSAPRSPLVLGLASALAFAGIGARRRGRRGGNPGLDRRNRR